ncbi:hypothetical protein LOTGIDRAFT_174450 [Lottia gigantea]|uniref:SWIM-type domain-containing protein n=1 Tax=Lottia gigantea TaxID=225164 RepID=V4A2D4_LOTGI|nr:hypothetical protein LOTGIDRAFT_174450 [Lottia gigantea]ESO98013.1 hypothetical protein LOTGIDRAFT_174450 [Lottia gigantea]
MGNQTRELSFLDVDGATAIAVQRFCNNGRSCKWTKRDYGLWDLTKLRKEFKSRVGKVSGRKKDSIERLEFFDRNKDIEHEKLENEYSMEIPNYDLYKDINTDTKFSLLKLESILCYHEQFQKKLDDDWKTNRFLRIASTDGLYFFKSECHTEMKKKVSYHIDIDGIIAESQCECAAGNVPTICKATDRTNLEKLPRLNLPKTYKLLLFVPDYP